MAGVKFAVGTVKDPIQCYTYRHFLARAALGFGVYKAFTNTAGLLALANGIAAILE